MKVRIFRRRFTMLFLTSAILGTAAAPASAQLKPAMQDRTAILGSIARPEVQQVKQRLDLAVRRDSVDWAAVEALLTQSGLDEVGKEFLLHGTLMRIREFEPDADAMDFVVRMRSYDSKVYVRHEEGPLPVAVYPIATVAEGTLDYWHRRDVKRNASIAMASGDLSSLRHVRRPGTDEFAGVLAALDEADAVTTTLADEWLAANAGGVDFYEARAITALKGGDRREVSGLLRSGNGPAAVRLLRAVRSHFDAGAAFDLLRDATANPSVASAAVFEIDALRHSALAQRVDDYLIDALADSELGATAAAIVARRGDHDLFVQVADVLDAPGATAVQQARAVLALTLAKDPYARLALEDAVKSEGFTDPDLHQDVVRWLQN